MLEPRGPLTTTTVTIDDLLQIIGTKQVELELLRARVTQLEVLLSAAARTLPEVPGGQ